MSTPPFFEPKRLYQMNRLEEMGRFPAVVCIERFFGPHMLTRQLSNRAAEMTSALNASFCHLKG